MEALGKTLSINSKLLLNNGLKIPMLALGTWTAMGKEC